MFPSLFHFLSSFLCPEGVFSTLLTAECDVHYQLLTLSSEILSQQWALMPLLPPSLLSISSPYWDHSLSGISVINYLLWQKYTRQWANKCTNTSQPSGTKTSQAFIWARFALSGLLIRARLVLSGHEQYFYSFHPFSPRDPKWDIDILAGSVLGLALDAPECSP